MNTNLSGRELQDEVTPFSLYTNRRRFMKGIGAVGTLAASAAAYLTLTSHGVHQRHAYFELRVTR